LRANTPGLKTVAEAQRDLCRRLERTLTALADFGKLEIRLHDARFRGWLHLFDDKWMVFGMTPRGTDGLVSPAIELEPVAKKWTLFDHMVDWSEDAWNHGKRIEDLEKWKTHVKEIASGSNTAGSAQAGS
jgi:hypothetical protein